jgi:hypothetical protein
MTFINLTGKYTHIGKLCVVQYWQNCFGEIEHECDSVFCDSNHECRQLSSVTPSVTKVETTEVEENDGNKHGNHYSRRRTVIDIFY